MLAFLISLLDYYFKDDKYTSVFISTAAVLGVDTNHRWKDLLVYTPMISAIVTVARMLVLYTAVKM
jgi:hypothetical protein